MSRRHSTSRSAIRTWLLSHGVRPAFISGLAVAVALGAAGTHAAGRRVAPRDVLVGELGQDPALLSPILLAVACGLVSLSLRDSTAWLTDVAARSARRLRAFWAATQVGAVLLLAAAATPLLSARTDAVHVYWSFLPLWLGSTFTAAWLGGTTAGTLAALLLCLGTSLHVLPWEANLVFNPALLPWRLAVGGALLLVGGAGYAVHGARRSRGVGSEH